MKEGDLLDSRVIKFEDHGLYLECEGKTVFVKAVDLSWEDGPIAPDSYKKGEGFKVKILKVLESEYMGAQLLGSLKDVDPSKNPWESFDYSPGSKYDGVVSGIAEYGVLVKLSTGVIGLIQEKPLPESLQKGQSVEVEVSHADILRKRLLLTYLG